VAEEKKDKWISIMIIPEDGAGVKKWRITTRNFFRLKIVAGICGALLLVGIVSAFSLGVVYARMKHYQSNNIRLIEATKKLGDVQARLERFQQNETRLRELLGGDIELPKAPEKEIETASADTSLQAVESGNTGADSGNEIQQAITRQELAMRKKPSIWPVNGAMLSDKFRDSSSTKDLHQGIDIVAPSKSNVVAVADGKVIFSGNDETLGLTIAIDHENGWETRYGHNRLLLVKYGDIVRKGQPIAIYGGTGGVSTGTHLHFAMYFKGKPVNPLDHLPSIPGNVFTKR
jgi:murein DD-endopeptidase MepM/ murein hydrolase activator NlpD